MGDGSGGTGGTGGAGGAGGTGGKRREDAASGAALLAAIVVIAGTFMSGIVRDDWETVLIASGAAGVLLDFIRIWFKSRR